MLGSVGVACCEGSDEDEPCDGSEGAEEPFDEEPFDEEPFDEEPFDEDPLDELWDGAAEEDELGVAGWDVGVAWLACEVLPGLLAAATPANAATPVAASPAIQRVARPTLARAASREFGVPASCPTGP